MLLKASSTACRSSCARPGRRTMRIVAAAAPAPPVQHNGARTLEKPAAPAGVPADIEEVLYTQEQVATRTQQLARQICRDYAGKDLVVVGVLKGAFIFMSDLTRAIASEGMPSVEIDFVRAASYGSSSVSNGKVALDLCGGDASRWAGRHILLVEDIIDSGNTLKRLAAAVGDCGAASVRVVALLDKKGRRQVDFHADYTGWEIPDKFIVGYGLDFNETYRCLPYVAALKPEAYAGSH